MVSRGRHPKAPIANALAAVVGDGLKVVEVHKGHRWGVLICIVCGDDLPIYSTPRVPEDTAARIKRFAAHHQH